MRNLVVFVVLTVGLQLVAGKAKLAPLYRSADPIKGEYIVVLKDGSRLEAVTSALTGLIQAQGVETMTIKTSMRTAINAFTASIPSRALRLVRSHSDVRYVEEDGYVYADDVTWGLDRIDQADLPLDNSYTPVGDGGEGVNVYVLDTGIRTTHEEFEGSRAFIAYDAMKYAIGADGDCQGHGTHCAGTIGGKVYGVAPKANVWSVRVLGCQGSGSKGGVMEGTTTVIIDGVAENVARLEHA